MSLHGRIYGTAPGAGRASSQERIALGRRFEELCAIQNAYSSYRLLTDFGAHKYVKDHAYVEINMAGKGGGD
jgi:hypothetical protein